MASIITGNYGVGHTIVLKDDKHLSTAVKTAIHGAYKPGDKFVIAAKTPDATEYIFGKGNAEIFLKDSKNNVIKVVGGVSSIEGSFNHFSEKGKSNTNLLTEVKEVISLYTFLHDFDLKDEDKLVDMLPVNFQKFYSSDYFLSAVKQNKSLKKFGYRLNSGYIGERQSENFTAPLYEAARKISKLHADNWNPADVWLMKSTFKNEYNKFINSIDIKAHNIHHINQWVKTHLDKKNLIPISLKHVSEETAHTEIVEFGMELHNMDFSLSYVDMDITAFNNFIPWTKCNFAPRCGFKSSKTSTSVFVEGRMKGAGYQLGAVDKKAWVEYTKRETGFKLVDSYNGNPNDALNEKLIKEIYKNVTVKMKSKATKADDMIESYRLTEGVTRKRANNLISSMYMLTVAAPKAIGQKEFYEWLYMYARKITENSCSYVLSH